MTEKYDQEIINLLKNCPWRIRSTSRNLCAALYDTVDDSCNKDNCPVLYIVSHSEKGEKS